MTAIRRNGLRGLLFAVAAGVCLAQMPPSDSGQFAAKIASLTGRVSVLKDNQPWALSVGDAVQVRQMIVSGPDGHALFQVSDGSTFEVFPNSTVVFRKNVPNWTDLLDVLIGRVRIHIQKWGKEANPNRIYTPTAVISVRGTTFDVAVNDDDESTIVEVEEGEVAVQHALLPSSSPKILHGGESVTVYRTSPLEAHLIDKGMLVRHGLRALMDAVYTAVYHNPRGIPGIGGSSGGSGDTKKPPPPPAPGGGTGNTTPPPPPPPPPPAPPH